MKFWERWTKKKIKKLKHDKDDLEDKLKEQEDYIKRLEKNINKFGKTKKKEEK